MHDATVRPTASARRHLLFGLVCPLVLLAYNMGRVWSFTVDDAYISYRYARNFARGLGLVYNAGERVEGYTNFLWTVLLGVGIRLDADPDLIAKIAGALASGGSLVIVYLLSKRLRPYRTLPCLATWLMASSIVQSGYAVFGLETALFVFLILAGLELSFRERDRGTRRSATAQPHEQDAASLGEVPGGGFASFPWSGVVFGLAGLTRPEAPMFVGLALLFLHRRLFDRQNIVRGVIVASMVASHMLWRYSYYGAWLPNTALAKTGTLSQQLRRGGRYIVDYFEHTWLVLALVCVGIAVVLIPLIRSARIEKRWSARWHLLPAHTDALCILTLACASFTYVLVIGADWMPYFRFLAPFEPFAFVLACVGVRAAADGGWRLLHRPSPRVTRRRLVVAAACLIGFVVAVGAFRAQRLTTAQDWFINNEKVFWEAAAGDSATWLVVDGKPGRIAVWDIGYIGYATDYPLLDLFGLVEPTIAKLGGGYARRLRPAYLDRIFRKQPEYFVLVGAQGGCEHAAPAEERLRQDARFKDGYRLAAMIRHTRRGYWCIFQQK